MTHSSYSWQDLAAFEQALWVELETAVRSADPGAERHPWRTVALATVGADGAQVRTVVLRDLNVELRQLVFYTDARSPKVAELRADPRGQLLCWSAPLGWQLRLRCRLQVNTSGLDVTARWAAISHTRAAQDYLAPLAPGDAIPTEPPPPLQSLDSSPAGHLRHHFAVVEATVIHMDWLDLNAQGHRRAEFSAQGARWLVP